MQRHPGKHFVTIFLMVFIGWVSCPGFSSEPSKASDADRAGKNFIQTKIYSEDEDQEILNLYKGLRESDVCDGLDKAGLRHIGLMNPEILPLWKDTEHYTHRIIGIAMTARYVPTNKVVPGRIPPQEYDQWEKDWYGQLSPEPFTPLIRKGTVLVIEEPESGELGTIGSNNIMAWVLRGCVGVVTNAGARDTDEIITEKVPLYFKKPARGIRPGRNEIESVNRPVVCGGVLVRPGDVLVADSDGVVVTPREYAKEVAQYAREILEKDKIGRRGLYKQLHLPEDDSVK